MQANLDPTVKIKESDVDSYHVEFTRLEPQGEGPSRPNETKDMQIFGKKEWAQVKGTIDKRGIAVLNYHELRIVHDPTRKPEPKEPQKASPGRPAAKSNNKDNAK